MGFGIWVGVGETGRGLRLYLDIYG
jgi:hypothetical protein